MITQNGEILYASYLVLQLYTRKIDFIYTTSVSRSGKTCTPKLTALAASLSVTRNASNLFFHAYLAYCAKPIIQFCSFHFLSTFNVRNTPAEHSRFHEVRWDCKISEISRKWRSRSSTEVQFKQLDRSLNFCHVFPRWFPSLKYISAIWSNYHSKNIQNIRITPRV